MNTQHPEAQNILTIDIGGTSLKATILNLAGEPVSEYVKTPTPKEATPKDVIKGIRELTKELGSGFGRISMGFPGYVKKGRVQTAPNLGKDSWKDYPLAQEVADLFGKPVRLINDADQQGLGLVSGQGFEIVFTLGTGFGTALVYDGELLPHLELSHMPVSKTEDYDDYLGKKTMQEIGKERWNKRVKRVIGVYQTVFNYDTLYIGGGNAKHLDFELDQNIRIVSNRDGIKGGARLWSASEKYDVFTNYPAEK
ncbi:chromosome partitioning protein ParA [Pedobacter yulinensis]|uniref:Chromosome partitioning protein ParA n=1 Tax=Pedobacter yulinensis TaxID=2126353 RepID=A0A2T3HI85_9SPHI|nr:ROK family protein [Pedobacter yulinensis]PST82091.1 chromosome partitioning protein ParA [Pedobacter yulinensis]